MAILQGRKIYNKVFFFLACLFKLYCTVTLFESKADFGWKKMKKI